MSEKLVCQICGREYKNYLSLSIHITQGHKIPSKEYYDLYIKKSNESMCKNCGNQTKFLSMGVGYRDYCSCKCARNSNELNEIRKQTNLKKYGVEYFFQSDTAKEKIKNKNLEKYGVEYSFQNKEIREKGIKTSFEKYGTKTPLQSNIIKEKIKQTNLKKYGHEYGFQSNIIKEKIKQTNLKKYGGTRPSCSEKIKEKMKQTNLEKYNVEYFSQTNEFKEELSIRMKNGDSSYMLSFIQNPSKPQVELFNIIKELYNSAIMNHPVMNYSVDIVIPELMIAFEYDGSYWHQDKEKDEKRQREIEELGWRFIRYLDTVPVKEQIINDVNNIIFENLENL